MAIRPNERLDASSETVSDTGMSGVGSTSQRLSDTMNADRSGTSGPDSRGVAAQMQGKAEELMERAGEKARSRFDEGKHQAARELGNVASALRECGIDLDHDRSAMLAPYVSRVADQVERFSTYIDTHTPQDIARNVEHFARRNPAVFLGSCFALGMVAARFLKARPPELPEPYGYEKHALDQVGYPTRTGAEVYGAGTYEAGSGRIRNI